MPVQFLRTTVFLLLFCTKMWAGGTAVVAGIFKNAYLNDRLELHVPHYFLDGKSSKAIELVDGDGRFKFQIHISEPQVVFLIHNEDRLAMYLEPNDSVFLSTDLFQFPLVVSFSGRGAQNNRLYRQFLQENPNDFNEFNNLRYKIGYLWTTVEANIDQLMNDLPPDDFKAAMDKKKWAGFGLLDDFTSKFPNDISKNCQEFLAAEILYDWAYHLLFYGNIYKNKHHIDPAFFEFSYDAPVSNNMVGSEAYRRYLMTFMAWRQREIQGSSTQIYADQYLASGDYLNEKALAFFRSEIIMMALKSEKYAEILPFYTTFLQGNAYHEYDEKITDLYEKAVKVSPGVLAPDIMTTDILGNQFSLGSLRGKVVYLNFWASWCASCLKKMNYFDEFANDLEKAGVVIVNVSLDEDQERWSNTIIQEGLRGTHLLSSRVPQGSTSISKKYNVEAVPQYFLLNRSGSFADKGMSHQPEDIRKRLIELTKNF